MATGEFNGDNDNADVVVGMPRGANLTGKVVLYTSTLENIFNMTGDQIGAYYGYSVASGGKESQRSNLSCTYLFTYSFKNNQFQNIIICTKNTYIFVFFYRSQRGRP